MDIHLLEVWDQLSSSLFLCLFSWERISLNLEVLNLSILTCPPAPEVSFFSSVQQDSCGVGNCCCLQSLESGWVFSALWAVRLVDHSRTLLWNVKSMDLSLIMVRSLLPYGAMKDGVSSRGGRLFLLLLFYFKAPDDSFRCQVFTLGGHSEIISMLVSLTMKSKMAICSTVRKMIDAQL